MISDHVKADTDEVIKADADGLILYGKFRFECGDGDVSAMTDLETSDHIVPLDCVLTLVKTHYTIGYYIGDVDIDGESKVGQKVFFVITKDGSISFHLPSEKDPRFFGREISNPFN
ncbi:hypothetical protein Rhal01_03723 [Rubritalea halochordaticola]|uniref:Uncharacterized protein n=2 Tax=Rubritalea halochordaticola TaxID=714537 RepID=A0ABP9VA79_9BACT